MTYKLTWTTTWELECWNASWRGGFDIETLVGRFFLETVGGPHGGTSGQCYRSHSLEIDITWYNNISWTYDQRNKSNSEQMSYFFSVVSVYLILSKILFSMMAGVSKMAEPEDTTGFWLQVDRIRSMALKMAQQIACTCGGFLKLGYPQIIQT
jgi:hypothetical protein